MYKMRIFAVAATAVLLAACSSAEERADKYLVRAQASFESGDMVKAGLDAKNTLQIEPQNADARFLLARIAETQLLTDPEKWREMMANLQRVIELDPNHVEARTKLAQLYMRFLSGNDDKTQILELIREQIDVAASVAPDDETVRTLLPMVAYHEALAAGDNAARDNALAQTEAIFKEDPANVLATSFLAGLNANTDPDKALDYLDQSLQAKSQPALRVLKIGMLQNLDRLSEAEAEYLVLMDENPENNEIRYGLVRFYAESGQMDKAEQLLRNIIAANAEDVQAKEQLVRFLIRRGDAEQAEQMLKAEIAATPEEYQFQFLLAQLKLQQEKVDDAEQLLQQIADQAGANESGQRARVQLARMRIAQDRRTESEEYLDEILAEEPANPDALVMKSALQMERADFDSAIAGLRTVLRNDPTSERALMLSARAHMAGGNSSLAKESYQKLIAAHPKNVQARRALAQLMVADREWEEVRALLLEGNRLHPDDLQITRMLVDVLIRLEDWQAAQVQADRIIGIEETTALGHYLQGRIHMARADYDKGASSFETAISLQPKAIEPLTNLVRARVALGQADQARRFLEQFLIDNEQNVHAQTLLAEVYARLKNWDKAIAANSRALELNDRWVPAYRNLIGLHLLQNQLTQAESAANGALEVMPDNADLQLLLATVYERQERFDDAIQIYQRELQRNPDLDVAANNYAALIADHQTDPASIAQALGVAQRFRNSDNPIFLDTLGWLLYRNGDFADAIKVLEEAVAGAPRVAQLRYHLGMAYYAEDRLSAAKTELSAAVADAKDFVGIEEARKTLELL